MLGEIFHKMLVSLGLRKAQSRDAAASTKDDFVARYGLSHEEPPDPLSKEVRFETERQKGFRRKH